MVWGLPVAEGRRLLARMDKVFEWFVWAEFDNLIAGDREDEAQWLMGPRWMVYVRYWEDLRALAEAERDVRPAVLRRVRRR
jgi:hypothetical protein